jgi:hypothetical protein
MPSPDNAGSPITLVSFGRSGSSLIANAFERHPEFSNAGETVNLIIGTWRAVELANPVLNASIEDGRYVTGDVRAARLVRQALATTVPSDRPRWFQKPIGVPVGITEIFSNDEWDEAATWYWKVFAQSFPGARYFTILRNPFDVILSARDYWGYDEATLWWSLGLMSHLLSHPSSLVKYAVRFEDLVRDPRDTVGALFEHLEVPFHEDVMAAFSQVHVPAKGREQLAPGAVSRRSDWDGLDPSAAQSGRYPTRFLGPVLALFEKFDIDVEIPVQFKRGRVDSSTPDTTPDYGPESAGTAATTAIRLEKTIARLNAEIERLHIEYRNDYVNTKEQEHRETLLELKSWIAELEKANAWLVEENKRIKSAPAPRIDS